MGTTLAEDKTWKLKKKKKKKDFNGIKGKELKTKSGTSLIILFIKLITSRMPKMLPVITVYCHKGQRHLGSP
jgi:hypothetical protein